MRGNTLLPCDCFPVYKSAEIFRVPLSTPKDTGQLLLHNRAVVTLLTVYYKVQNKHKMAYLQKVLTFVVNFEVKILWFLSLKSGFKGPILPK